MSRRTGTALLILLVALTGLFPGHSTPARAGAALGYDHSAAARPRETAPDCSLLDDPIKRMLMSPAFELMLLEACGRMLPGVPFSPVGPVRPDDRIVPDVVPAGGPDARVNAVDLPGISTAQSETSIAINGNTGTLCVTWNDIYHNQEGLGICGYSRSTDGGLTWEDGGAMPPGPGNMTCRGDPSVAWRAADGHFYYASLDNGGSGATGMSLWRSTDDCASFQWYDRVITTGYEDKELLAVENNPTSPYYGRIYAAWLRLDTELHYAAYSDDTLNWSIPVVISDPAKRPAGAFPVIAPNGDLYIGWAAWHQFPFGLVDQEIVRSTDGGDSFSWVTSPLTFSVPPRDPVAEAYCNFIAIRGFMRYLPSLQLAITPGDSGSPDDYCLHVIYPYDPDGYGSGDAANVYYRRSCDYGQSWEPEVLLNDDGGLNAQFYPSLTANENGVVAVSWYDRRNDPNDWYFERWGTVSYDGGDTWEPNRRIGDVASPVYIDTLAFCYHGDYDLMAADTDYAYVVWADGRVYFNGHYDQDIWFDRLPLRPDFDLQIDRQAYDLCRPDEVTGTLDLGAIAFYDQPVTLSDSSVPPGVSTAFSVNPVTPLPGRAVYTVTVGAGAADGSYAWAVTGDSPTRTHELTVALVVNSALPDAPTPIEPPDGASGLAPGHILFQWSDLPEATSYHLQVDDDPAFGSPQIDVGGIETSSYELLGPLDAATTYYWRVGAANGCGVGSTSDVFSFSTTWPCVLLVDDDNGPDMRSYYEDALTLLGYGYEVYDVGGGAGDGPTLAELQSHPMVIWFSGDQRGGGAGPTPADEANLSAYLDGGGNLFLSSQDYLHDAGLTAFGQIYLGVGWFTDDGADPRVMAGRVGDPIGNGQTYFPTYPPDCVERADIVNPGAGGAVAFQSRTGDNLALDKDGGNWRTVFFATSWVPLHFIEADPEAEVLGRILDWFGGCPTEPPYPSIVVTPSALEAMLYGDQQLTQTLSISNAGGADLEFDLQEAPDLPWLFEEPISGTVAPGEEMGVDVIYNSVALSPGVYVGELDVESNDPTVPHFYVPVTLTVLQSCTPVYGTEFTWAPLPPVAGEAVTFTATASGTAPIAFNWNWGDGLTGTERVSTHVYTPAGGYTVTLVVGNACGEETVLKLVTVVSPPGWVIYLPLVTKGEESG